VSGEGEVTSYTYALGDADNVRKRLQGYLLSGDLESLGRFSAGLTEGIKTVARLAQEGMNGEIIFCGGDEVLLRFRSADFSVEGLETISNRFSKTTGATISFGVGKGTDEAFLNLARAKAMEPGRVFLSSSIAAGY
jgi:hypothetical protein